MNAKLEIKKADGSIEWIESDYHHIYYPQLPMIKRQYLDAGLGEVLSYQNPEPQVAAQPVKTMTTRQYYAKMHAEEHRENGRCPKCGTWCCGDCQV